VRLTKRVQLWLVSKIKAITKNGIIVGEFNRPSCQGLRNKLWPLEEADFSTFDRSFKYAILNW